MEFCVSSASVGGSTALDKEVDKVHLEHSYAKSWNLHPENCFVPPAKTVLIPKPISTQIDVGPVIVDVVNYVESAPRAPFLDLKANDKLHRTESESLLGVGEEDYKGLSGDLDAEEERREDEEAGEYDDWEEQVDQLDWSPAQRKLFARVSEALHKDRLVRLALHGHKSEVVRRRLSCECTALLLRKALAQVRWDPHLCHWLHLALCRHLNRAYLSLYLDALQVMRAKIPELVDRTILGALLPGAVGTTGRRPPDAVQAVLNKQGRSDSVGGKLQVGCPSPCLTRLRKLPESPILILCPMALGHSWGETSDRMKWWHQQFSTMGSVVLVPPVTPVHGSRTAAHAFLQQILEAIQVTVVEVKRQCPDKPIVLIGWRVGGMLAMHVSLKEQVSALVCFSPVINTMGGKRGEADDIMYDIKTPTLFVIGRSSHSANYEDLEDIRERLWVDTSLVVLGAADDDLLVSRQRLHVAGWTQSVADRCILEEVGDFLTSALLNPPSLRPPRVRHVATPAAPILIPQQEKLVPERVISLPMLQTEKKAKEKKPGKRGRPSLTTLLMGTSQKVSPPRAKHRKKDLEAAALKKMGRIPLMLPVNTVSPNFTPGVSVTDVPPVKTVPTPSRTTITPVPMPSRATITPVTSPMVPIMSPVTTQQKHANLMNVASALLSPVAIQPSTSTLTTPTTLVSMHFKPAVSSTTSPLSTPPQVPVVRRSSIVTPPLTPSVPSRPTTPTCINQPVTPAALAAALVTRSSALTLPTSATIVKPSIATATVVKPTSTAATVVLKPPPTIIKSVTPVKSSVMPKSVSLPVQKVDSFPTPTTITPVTISPPTIPVTVSTRKYANSSIAIHTKEPQLARTTAAVATVTPTTGIGAVQKVSLPTSTVVQTVQSVVPLPKIMIDGDTGSGKVTVSLVTSEEPPPAPEETANSSVYITVPNPTVTPVEKPPSDSIAVQEEDTPQNESTHIATNLEDDALKPPSNKKRILDEKSGEMIETSASDRSMEGSEVEVDLTDELPSANETESEADPPELSPPRTISSGPIDLTEDSAPEECSGPDLVTLPPSPPPSQPSQPELTGYRKRKHSATPTSPGEVITLDSDSDSDKGSRKRKRKDPPSRRNSSSPTPTGTKRGRGRPRRSKSPKVTETEPARRRNRSKSTPSPQPSSSNEQASETGKPELSPVKEADTGEEESSGEETPKQGPKRKLRHIEPVTPSVLSATRTRRIKQPRYYGIVS